MTFKYIMFGSGLLLLLVTSAIRGVSAADPLEDLHIIDWHVHVAGLGHGGSGAFINAEMRDNFRFGFFLKWMQVTEEELER